METISSVSSAASRAIWGDKSGTNGPDSSTDSNTNPISAPGHTDPSTDPNTTTYNTSDSNAASTAPTATEDRNSFAPNDNLPTHSSSTQDPTSQPPNPSKSALPTPAKDNDANLATSDGIPSSRNESNDPRSTTAAGEPSVSADPASGQAPAQKQQGGDRPEEAPGPEGTEAVRAKKDAAEAALDKDTSAAGGSGDAPSSGNSLVGDAGGVEETQSHGPPAGGDDDDEDGPKAKSKGTGTGEQWVKTSGMAADGGDFDATKPGAGREADRLLEEKGVHRTEQPKGGDTGADDASGKGAAGKPRTVDKIKGKLHLGSH